MHFLELKSIRSIFLNSTMLLFVLITSSYSSFVYADEDGENMIIICDPDLECLQKPEDPTFGGGSGSLGSGGGGHSDAGDGGGSGSTGVNLRLVYKTKEICLAGAGIAFSACKRAANIQGGVTAAACLIIFTVTGPGAIACGLAVGTLYQFTIEACENFNTLDKLGCSRALP